MRIDDASKRVENPDWFRLTLLYYHTLPPMAPFVDPLDPANASDPNRREPDAVEVFDNLVHTPGTSNNVLSVVNTGSRLVTVAWDATGPGPLPVSPNYAQLATGTAAGGPVGAPELQCSAGRP